MINKINKGNLEKLGKQINQEANQWERKTMKPMVKSRGKINVQKNDVALKHGILDTFPFCTMSCFLHL